MSTTHAFSQFHHSWFNRLHHILQQLSSTAATLRPPLTPEQNNTLRHLIDKVMSHHHDYYRAKSFAAEKDPLTVFVSPWATTLERSLHWIAGWRPTTAFHLVYTESSVQFESHIVDILRGIRTGDLGDLSPAQFRRVSELQCDTVIFNSLSFFIFFLSSNLHANLCFTGFILLFHALNLGPQINKSNVVLIVYQSS
ncbi:putative transcription factor TGA like domain-containing protein [Lupinus albus]|uniref:Putative transcription factor TGA like domain-containing protein n=1 Tax=Lupinus albus TaxID=3870 RepID=A0A6A4NCX5_LUPAL|nr:putative transcription factor TGA like domain-containing protein [Lupinus albus]